MTRIMGVVAALALIAPGSALAAGSSTCQAYSSQLCSSISNTTATATATATTATASEPNDASSAAALPFTGIDVGLLVAGGGTLLGAGLVVRRLTRRLN